MRESYVLKVPKELSIPSKCSGCWSQLSQVTSLPKDLSIAMTQDPDSSFSAVTYWECAKCGQHYAAVHSVHLLPLEGKPGSEMKSYVNLAITNLASRTREMLLDICSHF